MSIDNEELSSLLTTIRNQEREIEVLNKEAESMRKNIEHFNEEHLLREKPEAADEAPADEKPKRGRGRAKKADAEPAEAPKKRGRKPKAEAAKEEDSEA